MRRVRQREEERIDGAMEVLRGILARFRGLDTRLGAVVALAGVSSLLRVACPQFAQRLVEELGKRYVNVRAIVTLVGLSCLIYLVSQGLSLVASRLSVDAAVRVGRGLRDALSEKLPRLPVEPAEGMPGEEGLERLMDDVATLEDALSTRLSQVAGHILLAIGVMSASLAVCWQLAFVVLLCSAASVLVVGWQDLTEDPGRGKADERAKEMGAYLQEIYPAEVTVADFGYGTRTRASFERLNEELERAELASGEREAGRRQAAFVVADVGFVLVIFLGVLLVRADLTGVGELLAISWYARELSLSHARVVPDVLALLRAVSAGGRVLAFLSAEEETRTCYPKVLVPWKRDGVVGLSHVSCDFGDEAHRLRDVSLAVASGQHVALVADAQDSSTISDLLLGFAEVGEGTLTVDGVDVRSMELVELRSHFGCATSRPWFFEGTIGENLRIGREGATDEEVVLAARAVGVDGLVQALPGGYEHRLTQGDACVGAGMRQLLGLARALVGDPEILLLSGATSEIDERSEAQVWKELRDLLEGHTVLVFTRRLCTFCDCSKLFYLEQGELLEAGTHEELMARDGAYAKYFNKEMQ